MACVGLNTGGRMNSIQNTSSLARDAAHVIAALSVWLAVTACGEAVDNAVEAEAPIEVGPRDFVLRSCPHVGPGRDCLVVQAGGKTLLFGAAPRALDDWSDARAAALDAVLLFNLRGENLEGLDEIRNHTWRAGRRAPLPVAGPIGTDDIVRRLNEIYVTSDALAFVEHNPPGGFDAALLTGVSEKADAAWKAFDTGDLNVWGQPSRIGQVKYLIVYGGVEQTLTGCSEDSGAMIGCDKAGNWLNGEAIHFVLDR